MPDNLVSVIIPTRNRASYLKQAVDSVYAQTYQDFEIIVVDDGSSDNTRDMLKSYDNRLKYIAQNHRGVSAARNNGISRTQGQYIAFLDDDDIFVPEKLEICVNYLSDNPQVIWLCSGFSFIDAAGHPLSRNAIIPEKTDVTLHDIAMFTFIHTSSVMVRKTNLIAAGGFPEKSHISEDYHTWAKILKTGKGAALTQCLTRFRQHPGNTKLPYPVLLRENTRIIDDIMASNDPALQSRETYIRNLYRIIGDNLRYKRQYVQYAAFCVRKYFALRRPESHP